MPFHAREIRMIRFVFTVVVVTCSVAFTGSAQAQTVASLGGEPASFFERLWWADFPDRPAAGLLAR